MTNTIPPQAQCTPSQQKLRDDFYLDELLEELPQLGPASYKRSFSYSWYNPQGKITKRSVYLKETGHLNM